MPYMDSKIYVLQLENRNWLSKKNFYVGCCKNFPDRVQRHITGRGALWTKKYRPVRTVAFYWGEEAEEKAVTLHYMAQYGVNNVRGWVFCKDGFYDESFTWVLKNKISPPLDIAEIKICEELSPMKLEKSLLWEKNRRDKTASVFQQQDAW